MKKLPQTREEWADAWLFASYVPLVITVGVHWLILLADFVFHGGSFPRLANWSFNLVDNFSYSPAYFLLEVALGVACLISSIAMTLTRPGGAGKGWIALVVSFVLFVIAWLMPAY